MKISVLTMWYNEKFLAPFFLNHYSYVDQIRLLLATGADDSIYEICSRYPNVEIENFDYLDMRIDDIFRIQKINETVSQLDCDWIFAVDADEFIFPLLENPRDLLSGQDGNLLYARMWQVYRHITDSDLDPNKPAIMQRRHGDPNVTEGINRLYNKPIIVKPETGIRWFPGLHGYEPNDKIKVSDRIFLGVHWSMADVDMAIERRIKGNRDRQSKRNLEMGFGIQHHHITEEEIRAECEKHLYDPQLF